MRFLKGFIVLAIVIFVLPHFLSSYGIHLFSESYIMAIFAISLGFILGYAGLASLGHAAFFGLGAYTVAMAGQHLTNAYLLILLGVLVAGLIAWLTGALFIRTSAFYFLMITLAFCQLLFAIAWQMEDWTGGPDGMMVSVELDFGWGPIQEGVGLYYVMGAAFLLMFLLLRLFVNSPVGAMIRGVQENEHRMKALGHNVRAYKLVAYTVSGMLAGFAGALYAFFNQYVSPELSSWVFSGEVLIMVIVGGVGTLFGPAVGAVFFILLQNYVSSMTEHWPLIMGGVFIIFVLLRRGGIVHLVMDFWKWLAARRTVKPKLPESKEGVR